MTDIIAMTHMGEGITRKYKSEDAILGGVSIVLPSKSYESISAACGTKFYTVDGTELKDVSSFEIKPTGVDDLLQVTLTFPIFKIGYQDV